MPTFDVLPRGRTTLRAFTLLSLLALVTTPSLAQDTNEAAPAKVEPKSEAAASDDKLAGFRKLRRDKPPEAITRDTHYWTGNEDNLQLFHPHVKDLGGVYIGVGTDQNYLMAGWAKSDVLVLMDFDQSIVDIHGVYRAIFKTAKTPEEFLDLWHAKKRKTVRKLVKEEFKKEKRKKWAALKAYGTARWSIYRRLVRIRDQFKDLEMGSFLSDQAQYDHIRKLYLDEKVFRVRGDLTAPRAMRSIGKAAKAADLPVRILYLSNAEQYFTYKRAFRKNIKALPLDDKSVIIRTSGWRRFKSVKGKDYYHYNVQSGPSMLAFVNNRKVIGVANVLKIAPPGEIRGFTVVTETDFAAAQKAAKQRKKEAWKKKQAAKKAKKGKGAKKSSKKARAKKATKSKSTSKKVSDEKSGKRKSKRKAKAAGDEEKKGKSPEGAAK